MSQDKTTETSEQKLERLLHAKQRQKRLAGWSIRRVEVAEGGSLKEVLA